MLVAVGWINVRSSIGLSWQFMRVSSGGRGISVSDFLNSWSVWIWMGIA